MAKPSNTYMNRAFDPRMFGRLLFSFIVILGGISLEIQRLEASIHKISTHEHSNLVYDLERVEKSNFQNTPENSPFLPLTNHDQDHDVHHRSACDHHLSFSSYSLPFEKKLTTFKFHWPPLGFAMLGLRSSIFRPPI